MKKVWLAGGCFWGVEAYFQQLKGVLSTKVGYGQGHVEKPTYQQVCSGTTGHTEVCEITYDESLLSLEKILEHFFRIIDPVTLNRQGPDQGTQYRSGVYYSDEGERELVLAFIKDKQPAYREPIVVEVEPVRNFYAAEDYHQNYLQKTPGGYCHINLMLAKPEEKKR
jgi:peptide-methionine (S)-S-oxide reductase